MTTQKLDVLLALVASYGDQLLDKDGDPSAEFNDIRASLRTLLEENARLLKVNDECAQELMDMCAHWKQKHEALRAAAQAVVDAVNRSEDLPYCVIEEVDSLEESLK